MGGLFFAAVVGSVGGGSPLAVLLCVVAGIVVYDIGVFGSELTNDLRRPVSHRDGEFIHAGAMLLIGGVTLVGSLLIKSLISAFNINSAEVTPIVLVLIFMVVLLLSILYLKENNNNYFFD
jgi:hypothetical protein